MKIRQIKRSKKREEQNSHGIGLICNLKMKEVKLCSTKLARLHSSADNTLT